MNNKLLPETIIESRFFGIEFLPGEEDSTNIKRLLKNIKEGINEYFKEENSLVDLSKMSFRIGGIFDLPIEADYYDFFTKEEKKHNKSHKFLQVFYRGPAIFKDFVFSQDPRRMVLDGMGIFSETEKQEIFLIGLNGIYLDIGITKDLLMSLNLK